MKRKILFGLGFFSLAVFLYLVISPSYIRNALLYQKVGIEDYPIFHNREVKTGEYREWKMDSLCNTYELTKKEVAKVSKTDEGLFVEIV